MGIGSSPVCRPCRLEAITRWKSGPIATQTMATEMQLATAVSSTQQATVTRGGVGIASVTTGSFFV